MAKQVKVIFEAGKGPFVVTRVDRNTGRFVRRGTRLYETADAALADAIRFDKPGQITLFVDYASAVSA